MIDETMKYNANDIQQNKVMAFLSYLSILVIIPIFVNHNSPFVRFHANQGLLLLVVSIFNSILERIFAMLHLGWITWIITGAIGIFALVCMIMGIVNSLSGRAVRLPIIGNIEILK